MMNNIVILFKFPTMGQWDFIYQTIDMFNFQHIKDWVETF